jgi:acetylornithine deacetylase/succinyl-diaminopimelate desuccinylase-like protein
VAVDEANRTQAVLARIDELGDELVELTLALANTYCPPGHEHEPAAVVRAWLDELNIAYDVVGAAPEERPSIVARIGGAEPAAFHSVVFNSHLDQPFSREDDHLRLRDPLNPKYFAARLDGERIYGYGAVNDKGPMAAWMIAAKAIRETGAFLGGDLFLTMVSGEIGQAPIDECQGVRYDGCGMGARDVAAVVKADYAVVAEATAFTTVWVEAGKADFKLTVFGDQSYYTPYIPQPTPSAIVRAAPLIPALQEWAYAYQLRETTQFEGGLVVPKVNIGCIRAGVPYNLERTPEVCHFYLDVRVVPGVDPETIRVELEELAAGLGLEAAVELYSFRPGAQATGIEPLLGSLEAAHASEFGAAMSPPLPETSSMWRDIIPFIDAGIPSLTYGPAAPVGDGDEFFMERADLLAAARVYARVALDLCNRERSA